MKRLIFIAVCLLILSGCSSPPPKEVTPEKVVAELHVKTVLSLMEDNFEGFAHVWLDEGMRTFMLLPIDETTWAMELIQVKAGDAEFVMAYNGMVESIQYMSEVMETKLPGYSIAIVNPVNHDNILLLVKNGVVLYNWVEDD